MRTMQVAAQGSCSGIRRIALTFDDAPAGDGPLMTGTDRTDTLIRNLARCGAKGAMFFACTGGIAKQRDGALRLRRYRRAGHLLANHSHGHKALSTTPVVDYLADIDRASKVLQSFGFVAPFFRHPYLDEGPSRDLQRRVDTALSQRSFRKGYVTVVTYDFYLQDLVSKAAAAGQRVDLDGLKDIYIEMIVGCANFYDVLAVKVIGRSPAHILLLHENDLAAFFLVDLVAALAHSNWKIVPTIEAFSDAIAKIDPDTVFRNQGHIAAIAHAAGWKRKALVPVYEEEDYIQHLFNSRVLKTPV